MLTILSCATFFYTTRREKTVQTFLDKFFRPVPSNSIASSGVEETQAYETLSYEAFDDDEVYEVDDPLLQ